MKSISLVVGGIVAIVVPYLGFLVYREIRPDKRMDFEVVVGLLTLIVVAVGFALWLSGWHAPPELKAVP